MRGRGKSLLTPLRPLVRGWALSAVGWGGLFLAVGQQITQTLALSWPEALRIVGPNWLVWTLLTPLIFRAVTRWPIERGHWLAAPVHFAVCLAILLALEGLKPVIGPPPMTPPGLEQVLPPLPRPTLFGRLLGGPNLPIYLAILGVAHALFFYRRGRERELRSVELAASLAEARLQALRMQLQPHFLFNSLNALGSLMHEDVERADEMLCAISDFLRLTLKDSGRQEVPLEREMEYAANYLAIEKIRFGDRLDYSIELPADLRDALVPSLFLQPIIENAVRHGVEPRRGSGSIILQALPAGDYLRLIVSDDGEGMADDPALGVGISNTSARLRELYGEKGSLQITANQGTVVQIRLPLRHEHEAARYHR